MRAVALRMLGSPIEAEDAVQEAWLKLSRADASAVENFGAWLTTVVARVCLDMLRARRSRREEPLDGQVAEPATAWPAVLSHQRRLVRHYDGGPRRRNVTDAHT
jgi:RNA polymerase sigma-70 factor (ECF subfamily)